MGCGASSDSSAQQKDKDMKGVGPSDSPSDQGRHRDDGGRHSIHDFSFGDNQGATTVGEEGGTTEDPNSPSPAGVPVSRRIAVSAEPILPDAAEQFHPRYIEKDEATVNELKKVVTGNYLFAALEPEELNTVVGAMERETFTKGSDILSQGLDSTEKFYFIVTGTVDIIKKEVKENGGIVCSFTKGQTFGELELMYLAPCAATVRCATDLEVYSIDRDTYRHIVMMVSIRKRRLYKELLGTVPFLKGMSDYDAMTLADALSPVTFQPGDHILSFGQRSDWMYIIVSGVVKVVGRDQNDEKKQVAVCDLGQGETVGELEFLNGHPAVADCIASESGPVKACRLHRAHFEMCMGPVVDFLKKNSNSEKYGYYHNVVSEEEGGTFAHFKFGDSDAFTAFGGGAEATQATTAGSDEEDGQKSAKPRRIAVSDESAEEADPNWQPPVFPKSGEQAAMLKDVLRQNPLLGAMEGKDLDVVIAAMQPMSFAHGTYILTQGGDGGEHYYIISKGVVEILKQEKLICTFSVGQGFGEMELMYIQPCVASVKARTDVETWAIDRQTYKKLVMKLAINRRQLYSELLGKIDFLSGMAEYDRNTLADALSPEEYQPGQTLIRRGETNEWMFIIIEGRVEVLGVDEGAPDNAPRKHICYLEVGDCVGELEFLNQHRAVADCVAAGPLRVAKLHRDHFELCMGPVMDVLRKTVRKDKYEYYNTQLEELSQAQANADDHHHHRRRRAKAVSAETDDDTSNWTPPTFEKQPAELQQLESLMRKTPLFAAMPASDRSVLVQALRKQTFPAGTVLIQQGEVPDEPCWNIVESGTAEQKVQEADGTEKVIAKFGPGHAFGELELMYSTPASGTTVTLSDLTIFRLDRRSYRKIVMKLSTDRRALYKELLTGVPFLASLSDAQQDTLADALSPVHFAPGDYLIRNGSHNEYMYIIADGVVEVFSGTGEKICDLRRGEMVGELEFLHSHAAVADCVAKTHVSACQLHRDHFELCLGPVEDYIEETLKQPKYSYYNSKRSAAPK